MLDTLRSDKYRPKVVIFTVYLAMLIDCLLFTIVVPILPDYLIRIKDTNDTSYLDASLHRQNISNFTQLEHEQSYHEAFVSNNIPVAMLLGSKAVVQIPTGLIVSQITYRIGYSIPLFIGFIIIIVSSLLFAFATSYWTLFFARSLNGVGSGFTAVSGLGMLAETFPDNVQRGKAIALAFGGIAIGITAGPVIGGFLYSFGGIVLPFGLLAGVSLLEGGEFEYEFYFY
ncbi:unnamed protein product [Bursaphelenchus okinawaensis]|uniref:Major facilitator superfamily (MFS) profile domain-containing protein n=1 Tax=Bursaphelenchus okinawaensis TaxID=465554 RepID=A0A811LSY9_9BILA|nr:unnamed protein product [Bursaphelenchus okinawaensis]CAG9128387.1 unnamed protein product [Bursaphelenchus okinawaensis]